MKLTYMIIVVSGLISKAQFHRVCVGGRAHFRNLSGNLMKGE